MEEVEALVIELRSADDERIEAIKERLATLCLEVQDVRSWVETRARSEILEVQWELEEVLDATETKHPEPEPVPEPETEEEEIPEDRPLTAADLDLIYDDPRGLALHRTKDGKRWFATQVHPQTRQPQTFELISTEVSQLKLQLSGSPHWLQTP